MACLTDAELALAEAGKLSEQLAAAARAHLAGCASCRERAAALRSGSGEVPADPTAPTLANRNSANATPGPLRVDGAPIDAAAHARMGRYLLLERVGVGGMGVVYAAYDPELDRKVALKLIRADSAADGGERQTRLQREARAMARLSHPNVVAVHDVGTFGSQLFVAMDFVAGDSAGGWLAEKPRSWREIVEVFLAAGRGLAAAHGVGIVHRDFKADNVLVGKDGSVKVTDFGIATSVVSPPPGDDASVAVTPLESPTAGGATPGRSFGSGLTEPGTVMGTPVFMAPEQHFGQVPDPRSDQFSFCVALYEALYGQSPYAAKTIPDLAFAKSRAEIAPPPPGKAPAHLWAAIRRGLSPKRDDRFPDMGALLAALAVDPSRRRRRIAGAALLLGVLAVGVLGAVQLARARVARCSGAEEKLAGVWDEGRRKAIADAIAATALPYGAPVRELAGRTFDRFAKEFVAMRTEACEATRVRGDQTEELLGQRMECLDRHLREARVVSDAFAKADKKVVERGAELLANVGGLAECADTVRLRQRVRPPPAAEQEKAAAIETRLAEVRVMQKLGAFAKARPVAEKLSADARALGYGPLVGETVGLESWFVNNLGDVPLAEKLGREAFAAYLSGGDDAGAARMCGHLSFFVRYAKPADAEQWVATALAISKRMGDPDDVRYRVLTSQGLIFQTRRKDVDAIRVFTEALEREHRAAGEDHPDYPMLLAAIGGSKSSMGQVDEALALFQKSVEARVRISGPSHPSLATPLSGIAQLQLRAGKWEEALETLSRDLAIAEAAYGPNHPGTRITHENFAAALMSLHRFPEALAHAKQAIVCAEKTPGPAAASFSYAQLAEVQLAMNAPAEALGNAEKAVGLMEKAQGPDHVDVAHPLTIQAMAENALHRPDRAIPPLERALKLRAASTGDPVERAATQFELAQSLWDAGKDRARARQLATDALSIFRGANPEEQHKIEQWLEKHLLAPAAR